MGATASEKAKPHHAPGSLPCQPRLCRACPRGRPPPLHRPPPHLLRPLCHLPRPRLQLLVGAVPAFTPYHNCVNKVTEVCYPVQKVEPTTVTEQSCLLKGE